MANEKTLVCGCFGTIYYAKLLKGGRMSDVGRVDVTTDALQAVTEHIMQMKEYKEHGGYAGYQYARADGGHIRLVAYDSDKFQITRKAEVQDDSKKDHSGNGASRT